VVASAAGEFRDGGRRGGGGGCGGGQVGTPFIAGSVFRGLVFVSRRPRRRGQCEKVASRRKRAPAKSTADKSATPTNKKKKTAAAAGAAATAAAAAAAAAANSAQVPSDTTATSPERTILAVAAWDLVRGKVENVVHEQNEAP